MLRNALLFIMTLMIGLGVHAKTYVHSFEDYVHLSDHDKNQIILKTMELMVEMESKYQHEVKKYGYSQERFEKFQKAVGKIQSLLFPEAYADDAVSSWTSYGNKFKSLLDQNNGDCIFAGWVSKTYPSTVPGKVYCAHPANTSKSPAAIQQSYPGPKGNDCKKNDPNKIQCNPAIFGFKKAADESLFCVSTELRAENSSYHCMRAALSASVDDKTDRPEDRLKFLRDNLASNPEIFKGVQEFVYQTCICEKSPEGFNSSYHSRIRPHRTCFGLLNMVGETVTCEDPKLPMDTSIFQSFRTFMSDPNRSGKEGTELDFLYERFVNTEVKTTATAEYNRLCGITPEIPVEPNNEDVVVVDDTPPFTCQSAVCTPKAPAAATPEGGGTDQPATEYDCKFTVLEKGQTEAAELTAATFVFPAEGATEITDVAGKLGEKDVTGLSCPLTLAVPEVVDENVEPTKKPTLKIEITVKNLTAYTVVATTTDDEGWSFSWSIKDKGSLPIKEGWKDPETKPADNSDSGMAVDRTEETQTDASSTVASSDNKTTVQSRITVNYEVCGQLSKGSEKVPEAPQCVTIDKLLITPSAGGGGGNQTPGQQQMIRQSSDTSAIGIK